jgi:hypothetical protein
MIGHWTDGVDGIPLWRLHVEHQIGRLRQQRENFSLYGAGDPCFVLVDIHIYFGPHAKLREVYARLD